MNLSHLYYFKKLVELGNYSAAAKELYIAQPTLSLAISGLEKELGVVLVKKKRGLLELTIDGEDLYEAAVVATNAIDGAVSSIRERNAHEAGNLRIGTVYSIQNQEWSRAISDFREHTSNKTQLAWQQGTTESLMADLKKGSLDIIFAGLLQKNDPDIESIPSFTLGATVVLNRANPLATHKEVSLDDLRNNAVITYRNNKGPFKDEIQQLFAGHSNLDVSYEYNDEITLCSLVASDPNLAAVACHTWLVESYPDVVTVKLKEAPTDFHRFYISYVKKDRPHAAIQEFVSFMKDYNFGTTSCAPYVSQQSDINVNFLK